MRETLLTDRLLIRDVIEADTELMFDIDSDSNVMHCIGPRLASNVSWYRDRIWRKFMPKQAHPWHGARDVFDRISGDYSGSVSIRPANESSEAQAEPAEASGQEPAATPEKISL